MIDWKYDILFSFSITHPGPRIDDFYLRPSSSCHARLKQLGLIFKSMPSGALIIQEKKVMPDGSLNVFRPILNLNTFTFILGTRNPSQLASIKPFDSALPPFSGRRSILYLDNLDSSFAIDTGLFFPAQTTPLDTDLAAYELPVSGKISDADLASLTPNEFSLLEDPTITNQLTLAAKMPNPPVNQTFSINNNQKRVYLELDTGAFKLKKTGSLNTSETIFADQALLSSSSLGIVQIFKDSTVDYNTTIKYDITFENA